MATFATPGIIHYGTNMAVANIDQDVANFYYRLLPKSIGAQKQMFQAHVTIVRYEDIADKIIWGEYDGEQVEIHYNNNIKNDGVYYWLDVQCERLRKIREELGLDPYPPWRNRFHITIGNVKHRI